MNFSDLPQAIKDRLNIEVLDLCNHNTNTPYEVLLYNEQGSRYFYARRICESWSDDKGNYMPFGGGTKWKICYGRVQFKAYKNPVGEKDYELVDGLTYTKSANGTNIPSYLKTKKDVLELIKNIGVFKL